MLSPRFGRLALCCLPLLRCRLARATTLLGLLSLAVTPLLLRTPVGPPPPLSLPGMPLGLAVDIATHRAVLTTVSADDMLVMDGPNATVRDGVALHDGYGMAVATDPISGNVYVVTSQSRLVVLASPLPTPLATIDLDQRPVALAVNPTSGRVYVVTRNTRRETAPDELVVVDGVHQRMLAEVPLGQGPLRVAVDVTTNRVYVTDDGSDTVAVLDGATNALLGRLPLGHGPHELAVNERTGRVYVSNSVDHSLSVLDGPHLRLLDTVAMADGPGAIGVNERIDRLYVATATGNVAVLDGRTGRLLTTLTMGEQPAGLAVDAATNRVYVADPLDGTVWLLQDGRFGHPSARLLAHAERDLAPAPGRSTCGCQ